MGEWRRQGDDVDGSVVTVDDVGEEEPEDYDHDSDSDTVSTGFGGDDDLTTDSVGNQLELAVSKKSETPSFGNIAVNNSSDVHFGNKTFYNGPVTIKQFVYTTSVDESRALPASPVPSQTPQPFSLPSPDPLGHTLAPEVTAIPIPDLEARKVNGNSFAVPVPSDPLKADHKENAVILWVRSLTRSQQVFYLVAASCVLVLLVTLIGVLATRKPTQPSKSQNDIVHNRETLKAWDRKDLNFTNSKKLRMIPRIDWLAQPVAAPLDPLQHPVPYVIISHSATEQCFVQAACTLQVRTIQTFHMESKGWYDIGYNFLVGGDGYCYIGRGWDYVGAHAYGYNNVSIGINFIGTFNSEVPPEKQMRAAQLVIQEGVELGKIAPDYKLLAHRQVSGTESPGQTFYEELKKWPHWAPTP